MLQTFQLKNGIKVVTYSIPEMRSVFLGANIKSGWFFDTKENNGAAHFMEHLLVQGIPSFPTDEALSTFIEGLAGGYNAHTTPQLVRFSAAAPAKHLKDIVKIAGEVLFEPLFPEESIEKERRAVLEEIRQREDSLSFKNYIFFNKVRFKKEHIMQLRFGGAIESVNKLQKKDLVEFYTRFFYPKNTYIAIVGGFKPKEVKEILESVMLKYSAKEDFPGYPKFTNTDMSDFTVGIREDKELNTCYVDLSYPSISDNEPLEKRLIQSLINTMLGRLRGSRLFRLLRQQRGLVYGVSTGGTIYQNFGYNQVSTQVIPENLEEVVTLIIKELKDFSQTGPSLEELNFAKNFITNQTLMQFDHPGRILEWIEDDLIWEGKIFMPEEYVSLIEKITVKDILKFMKEYWDLEKLNLTIQGPLSDTKTNVNKYTKIISELK